LRLPNKGWRPISFSNRSPYSNWLLQRLSDSAKYLDSHFNMSKLYNLDSLRSFPMITVTSVEAQNRFGQLLDTVQREPVTITRHGRTAGHPAQARERRRSIGSVERTGRQTGKPGSRQVKR
jgi:antitoxin (DNA-binding transcriptional repressor) of toxin-antitoxin stability system